MISAGNTIEEAFEVAEKYSLEHPKLYITIQDCFGLFLRAEKRLHVFAPSDCPWFFEENQKGYWKNGKFKPFTKSQKIQDQLKTPNMS